MSPTHDTLEDSNMKKNIDSLFKEKTLLLPATEEQWKQMYTELETTPQQLQEDIRTIRKWLSQQSHLPQVATDIMLSSFLTGCKNSIQRTKQKLDAYYSIRGQLPELCGNRDPLSQEAKDSGRDVRMYLLPNLDQNGYRLLMTSFKSPDTTYYDVKENLKRILKLIDVRVHTEGYYQGDFVICDAKYFSVGHALRLTPMLMKNFLHVVQEVLPLRIKGVLFYNAPPILEKTVNNVIKPFLKQKIRDRVLVYSEDHTILAKHFPREILPQNLGGDEEPDDILNDLWDKKLESWRDWFMNEGSVLSDESKRDSNASFKPANYFGVEGSFRKLSID